VANDRHEIPEDAELLPRELLEAWGVPEMPSDMKERVMTQIDEPWNVEGPTQWGASPMVGPPPMRSRASTIALLTAVAAAAASVAAVLMSIRPDRGPLEPRGESVAVVQQLPPAPRGHLTLEVDPPDAVVEVDGIVLQGPSPFVATDLSVGRHELRVHREGHVEWTRVVQVPQSQLHLPIKLVRAATSSGSEATRAGVDREPENDPSAKRSGTGRQTPAANGSRNADNLDVDCILAPDLDKCKKKGEQTAPQSGDPSLPQKLSQHDIKAAMDRVLPQARSCGPEHGAAPGEVVRVRLSIAGATGKVSSASAQEPHAGTPLGTCVAVAVAGAEFAKFASGSMGAIYPVRL
jgi:hypothetical protein